MRDNLNMRGSKGRPLRTHCRYLLVAASLLAAQAAISATPGERAQQAVQPEDALGARWLPNPLMARPPATSPDRRHLVYAALDPRTGAERHALYLQDGSDVYSEGSRLFLVDLQSSSEREICPGQGNNWKPAWSPDGGSIAFLSNRNGRPRLWVYELEGGVCREVSDAHVKAFYSPLEWPTWSNDGRTVYVGLWPESGPGTLETVNREHEAGFSTPQFSDIGVRVLRHTPRAAAAEQPARTQETSADRCVSGTSGSIAAVNVATGRHRILVDHGVTSDPTSTSSHMPTPMIGLAPTGSWLAYASAPCRVQGETFALAYDLYVVPTSGGAPIRVATGLPVMGGAMVDAFRWSPVADRLVFIRGGELWRVDVDADGPRDPARLGELSGLHPARLNFTPDGREVLVAVDPRPAGGSIAGMDYGLALVDVATGATRAVAYDRGRWSLSRFMNRDPSFGGTSSMLVLGTDKHSRETALFRIDARAATAEHVWAGTGTISTLTDVPRGTIATYEDFSTSQDLFQFTPDFRTRRRLTNLNPSLNGLPPAVIDTFETEVPMPGGGMTRVRTTVILPPGARRGDRVPAIVKIYPGSDLSSNLSTFGGDYRDIAQIYTSRGYGVVLASVPTGAPDQRGNIIQEITDALLPQLYRGDALGYIDASRLALRGVSFGGFSTAAIISQTNLFRAGIASSAMYDLGSHFGQLNYIQGRVMDNGEWLERTQPRLGGPLWQDIHTYIENSPYYRADRINTPLMILQGTRDPGLLDAEKMFAALRRLDRTVEVVLYEGGGHIPVDWRPEQARDHIERMLRFMEEHLGPGWTGR